MQSDHVEIAIVGAGAEIPDYARQLSILRYADADLMNELSNAANKGIL